MKIIYTMQQNDPQSYDERTFRKNNEAHVEEAETFSRASGSDRLDLSPCESRISEKDKNPSEENEEDEDDEEEQGDPVLPRDPRVWDAAHIRSWVKWITRQFNIEPKPDLSRFPTNGQELCELSKADFWVCAGSKDGGIIVAKYIAHLLYSVSGRETSPMLNDNEPSE